MRRLLCLVPALLLTVGCAYLSGEPATELSRAAQAGDLPEVRRLLASGANPNAPVAGFRISPLGWAARGGHTEVMAALLDGGARSEQPSGINGWTPLVHAIHVEQETSVRFLLSRTHPGKESMRAALRMAAGYGMPQVVTELLAAGGTGSTEALVDAVGGVWDLDAEWKGCPAHTEVVRVLLEASPDLRVPDTAAGRGALRFAEKKGCTEMLALVGGEVRAAR
jgi:ankyrin repeat protein